MEIIIKMESEKPLSNTQFYDLCVLIALNGLIPILKEESFSEMAHATAANMLKRRNKFLDSFNS